MEYIYFRIYQLLSNIKTNDTPALNSMLLLVILQAFNIFSIAIIFNSMHFYTLSKNQAYLFAITFYILLLIPNYLFLYRKLKKIISKYENEPKSVRLGRSIMVFSYIILSFVILFALGFNMR